MAEGKLSQTSLISRGSTPLCSCSQMGQGQAVPWRYVRRPLVLRIWMYLGYVSDTWATPHQRDANTLSESVCKLLFFKSKPKCSLQSCPNFGFKNTVNCGNYSSTSAGMFSDIFLRSYFNTGETSVWTTLQTSLQCFHLTPWPAWLLNLLLCGCFSLPLCKDLKFWCRLAQRWKQQRSQHFNLFLIQISVDFN